MRKPLIVSGSLILFVSVAGYLVGQQGPTPNQGNPAGTAVAKEILTLEGQVSAVELGSGRGQSLLQVDGRSIVLGPYRYLQAASFQLSVGDQVRVQAFRSPVDESRLVAVFIENLSTGQSLRLRDEFGRPLAGRRRGGRSFGAGRDRGTGPCGGAPQVELAQAITGTVATVNAEPGRRHPEIVLADGTILSAGPYRAWAESGFSVEPGETVTVVAFPCSTQENRWVIMSIEKAGGERLILRDEDGLPLGGRGGRGPRW